MSDHLFMVARNSRASALLFVVATSAIATTTRADDTLAVLPVTQVSTSATPSTRTDMQDSSGKITLDNRAVKDWSDSTGLLTDMLDTLPNVQFSDDADSEEALTSLKPQSISISGGRFYENNFSLNGLSINSLIDPAGAGNAESGINDISGHEMAIFVDTSQLESVAVYHSNVPAEYGRFTGGVVDATLRLPAQTSQSNISYYTTRPAWVNFHAITNASDEDDPNYSAPEDPQYSRMRFTASHERGLNDRHSARINMNYSRVRSPFVSLAQTEYSTTESASLTLTHGYQYDQLNVVSFIQTSPYRTQTSVANTLNSNYQLNSGGTLLGSTWTLQQENATHTLKLSANYSENSRSAPDHYFNWLNSNSRSWGLEAGLGSSKEGGFGSLDKYQSGYALMWKSEFASALPLISAWRTGADWQYNQTGFNRPDDTYIYKSPLYNTQVQCVSQTLDCVQREQYFTERQIYPADKVSVGLNQIALFSEVDFDFNRARLTLGARADHDDFLDNLNIAFRSRGSVDISADQRWVMHAGFNRYYGGPLLTYRLRMASEPYYQEYRSTTQNIVNDWEYDSETGSYRYIANDLETPYSDEKTLSINGLVFSGVMRIEWLARDGHDEFSREETGVQPDGYNYYRLNNDGFSHYRSIALSWDTQYDDYRFGFNITRSRTESSNASYDDDADAAVSADYVWYKGQRRTLSDIIQLREDYARPVIATLYGSFDVTSALSVSSKGRFKSAYTTVAESIGSGYSTTVTENGVTRREYLDGYADTTISASFMLDTTLRWKPLNSDQLVVVAEITNLFDRRTYTVGDSSDGIEVGRKIWLGVESTF